MPVFLGLDCGGSSCRALAFDEEGRVLHQGQSGPGNILSTPHSLLRKNLCAATRECPEPDVVCGCFAGLITEEERTLAETLMRQIAPTAKVQALPDYCAAFMSSPEGTHVCVIAGTGSILCSRSGSGWVKSGGRGYLLGNPASAFRYGQDALTAYLDQPSEATEPMKKAIQATFDSLEEAQIVAKLYRAPSPAALLAKLSPVIAKDYRAGKGYAKESLKKQNLMLAKQTADHLNQHFPDISGPVISLAGGVWESGAAYREAFAKALASQPSTQGVRLVRLVRPPVHGAAMLAKEMLA